MRQNWTTANVAVVEVLTSWGAVYAAIFLPVVLMLANFVFGSCFISEALGANQHTRDSLHTRHRVMGRGFIAGVLALLAWEYHVYFFASRAAIQTHRISVTAAACNPLYVLWDIADRLPAKFADFHPAIYLLDCAWSDVTFLALFAGFLLTYLLAVFSVPQVTVRSGKKPVGASYCRKCAAHVTGMCHHCYLIGNCVGDKNARVFMACLCFGVANLAFLLYSCGSWAFWQDSAVLHFGLVLVVVALGFLSALLAFQLTLRARGLTTLAVWKHSKKTGHSFWRVLLTWPAKQGELVDSAKR